MNPHAIQRCSNLLCNRHTRQHTIRVLGLCLQQLLQWSMRCTCLRVLAVACFDEIDLHICCFALAVGAVESQQVLHCRTIERSRNTADEKCSLAAIFAFLPEGAAELCLA